MDPQSKRGGDRDQPWGERLADRAAAGGGDPSVRRLVSDAIGVVRGRLSEVAKGGIQPLLDEAAAQVRPATPEELHARYPGLSDDEVARKLIDRSARTAAAVAIAVGGILAAQEAIAVATSPVPPAAGAALGTVGITALAEVLVLFVIEAKLRADLGALAGQRVLTPRELVAGVVGEVQAAGGLHKLRRRSLRRALPEAAVRGTAARIARLMPARFARIVIPEVIAPLVGGIWAARLASQSLRATGERCWGELRLLPRTTVSWGPSTWNGGNPAGPKGPGDTRSLPPPDPTWRPPS
jgi:hypothetical protein